MTQAINSNILSITAGYKFRTGALRRAGSSTNNRRTKNKSTLQIYRAYDKQRLLQQIDEKIQKRNGAFALNIALKQQLNKKSDNVYEKNWTVGQAKNMLAQIQFQNRQLCQQIKHRNEEIEKLKRTPEYTFFLETLVEYETNKEELSRIRHLIRQQKLKRNEQVRMKKQIKASHMNQIHNKQRTINERIERNVQLKQMIEHMEHQIRLYKAKNLQLNKNRKRLQDEIKQIKDNYNSFESKTQTASTNSNTYHCRESTKRRKITIQKSRQEENKTFNAAIKIKNKHNKQNSVQIESQNYNKQKQNREPRSDIKINHNKRFQESLSVIQKRDKQNCQPSKLSPNMERKLDCKDNEEISQIVQKISKCQEINKENESFDCSNASDSDQSLGQDYSI